VEFGGGWVCEKMRKKWRNEGDGGDGTAGVGVVTAQWCSGGWVVGFGDWWCWVCGRWEKMIVRVYGMVEKMRGRRGK
jgi:hypothetical protein